MRVLFSEKVEGLMMMAIIIDKVIAKGPNIMVDT